jgi:hypothetical protein
MWPSASPCSLKSLFQGEEERNLDRAAHDDGTVSDPREEARYLLCRTRYLHSEADRRPHALRVDRIGRLRKVLSGDVFDTLGMHPAVRGLDLDRRSDRALYSVALDETLYAGCGTTLGVGVRQLVELRGAPTSSLTNATYLPDVIEFCHHSTFVAGADVLCAGELATDRDGRLTYVSNHSGHYQPGKANLLVFVARLAQLGVDLARVTVGVVAEDRSLTTYPAAAWVAADGEGLAGAADARDGRDASTLFSGVAD